MNAAPGPGDGGIVYGRVARPYSLLPLGDRVSVGFAIANDQQPLQWVNPAGDEILIAPVTARRGVNRGRELHTFLLEGTGDETFDVLTLQGSRRTSCCSVSPLESPTAGLRGAWIGAVVGVDGGAGVCCALPIPHVRGNTLASRHPPAPRHPPFTPRVQCALGDGKGAAAA